MASTASPSPPPPVRILIINPNTSQQMTSSLIPAVESLGFPSVQYTFFTSPSPGGIPSINSPADAAESARICLPHLLPLLPHHDCFLVACYSQHPLVGMLKKECASLTAAATGGEGGSGVRKYVTGIFEASVLASLALMGGGGQADEKKEEVVEVVEEESRPAAFGIVSTGKIWEEALQTAVEEFIGCPPTTTTTTKSPFVGCETTGLNASELHDLPAEQVRRKMMEATTRLLRRGQTNSGSSSSSGSVSGSGKPSRVQAICLGCAGMVGLDTAVREACVETLGPERARDVYIVDGVKAGVGTLYGLARGGF
ncbi:uncharacterized protein Z520_10447 [Fonsecaea multimorphosa CBS 102226]|uniref:DCG1-like protein n=1 Tax=Fonsecaea multimorphosa CBS 102226 TaxID=1442371 RepID=A0A0D2JKN4_9EURO|nr:uncharacterized protein Z520_10447 [Fonsecaea multimorphosa CBS 102226]KIX93822.1 hypothetical protein Z520_10447 [Fonsecaea multimorphosa CBS 102226]